ncbi:MAG: ornithine cyclodeaminase family protein [Marinobacter sp.]|nr:ornithine cyclodeaminase family protein [Marinobacter sp.]
MIMISAEDIARSLPWERLVDRLEATFLQGVEAPPRHHHTLHRADGDATMLLMPAWEDDGYIGMKMVNVFPQNARAGLPAIAGVYLLCEGRHGRPLACMDGSELTRRRTAAASALAARRLSRPQAGTLLMVGTGRLAPMLIEAHAAVRPITRVLVWGRQPAKAEALADHYRDRFTCEVVEDLEAATESADIISCATLSCEPLIRGDWLTAGTHLDLVGAFRPDMRETDGVCFQRSAVFVDTYAGAEGEAGDLLQAVREGFFETGSIHADLTQLVQGTRPGRTDDQQITLFKSVGASLEDLAAAIEVWNTVNTRTQAREQRL